MKKMDTLFQTTTKQRKTVLRNPKNPREYSERRNPSNIH
jgi:hypothetical protein